MKLRKLIITGLSLGSVVGYLVACSSTSSDGTSIVVNDSESNSVQSMLGAVSAEASAGEGGTVSFMGYSSADVGTRTGSPGCSYTSARSVCSASHDTATFDCNTDGYSITLHGAWSETYSGTDATTCTIPAVSGETITRTTSGLTATVDITQTVGTTITTDTNGGTTYSGTVIAGGGNVTAALDTVAGDDTTLQRTLTIPGEHKVAKYRGRTLYDHIITASGITVTGADKSTRSIVGQATLYHNVASYTAVSTFNAITWSDVTCCYPSSGTISTTFTGSLQGTSTLLFGAGCGSAVYTNTSGVSAAISLTSCY